MARSLRLGITKTDPVWVARCPSDPDLQEAWKAGKTGKTPSNASCSKVLTPSGLFFGMVVQNPFPQRCAKFHGDLRVQRGRDCRWKVGTLCKIPWFSAND